MSTLILSESASGDEGYYTFVSNDATLSWGGTFAGESITLYTILNGKPEPIEDGVFTSAGQKILGMGIGATIKAVVSSVSSGASINMSATPRP